MSPSKHQEPHVDEVIIDVVEEVVGLNVAERFLENLKKYFQQMFFHTSKALKDFKRKSHLIVSFRLIKPL